MGIPGSCANVSGYGMFQTNGDAVADARQRGQAIAAAGDCANKSAWAGGRDMSMREAYAKCGWSPKDAMDRAIEWEVGPANDEVSPSQDSFLSALVDPTYSGLGSDDHFVHDMRKRGYASVVDEVMTEAGLSFSDSRLHLGAEVTHIDSTEKRHTGKVTVRTADGRVFRGTRVIVTLPLGVMQWQHSSLFQPPLPHKKVKALSKVTMGNFTKIFAEWPVPFWKDRGIQWLAAEDYSDEGIRFPMEFHD